MPARVSWFRSTSGEFSALECTDTQSARPSNGMETRCRKAAFPQEHLPSYAVSRDSGGRREEDGWVIVGLHSWLTRITLLASAMPRFKDVLELLGFIASSV